MGELISFPGTVQTPSPADVAPIAATAMPSSGIGDRARDLSDLCGVIETQLGQLASGLLQFKQTLGRHLDENRQALDFCRRASEAYLPDGSVDLDAYEALKAEWAEMNAGAGAVP